MGVDVAVEVGVIVFAIWAGGSDEKISWAW